MEDDLSPQKREESPGEAVAPRSLYIVTSLALGFFLLLAFLSILFPDTVWKGFVWKYFWGPVVADALGHPVDGIKEGYNIYNTLIYGLLLSLAISWVYVLLKKLRLEIDTVFIFALLPTVLSGGVYRAFEDTGLMRYPGSVLFISPLIYVLLALVVVSAMVSAHMPGKRAWFRVAWFWAGKKTGKSGVLGGLVGWALFMVVFYSTGFQRALVGEPGGVPTLVLTASIPLVSAFSVATVALYSGEKLRRSEEVAVLSAGTGVFVHGVLDIFLWFRFAAGPGGGVETHPPEIAVITSLALLMTFLVAGVLRALWAVLSRGFFWIKEVYLRPLSVLILFAHLLDASATYRAISSYGYSEKHVLPSFLINLAGTPLVMYPLKLAVILPVLYIMEKYIAVELKDRTMVGLLRLAVLVVGLAPGVRDMLRLSMGV